MTTLKLEREFAADPELVFAFVTQPEHLLRWWGHEGTTITQHQLDLSRPGPWSSVLMNANGTTHKVSGTVLAVDPPHSVEFTWAWHGENDERGLDTAVRFEVYSNGSGGTLFTLTHSGLADEQSAANHRVGWTSTFNRLERIAR